VYTGWIFQHSRGHYDEEVLQYIARRSNGKAVVLLLQVKEGALDGRLIGLFYVCAANILCTFNSLHFLVLLLPTVALILILQGFDFIKGEFAVCP